MSDLAPGSIAHKMVVLHDALSDDSLPHAFGGAMALAWCTLQARGTIDIDLNVFIPPTETRRGLDALPRAVTYTSSDIDRLTEDGQARLWWDSTPVDIFLSTTEFHDAAEGRVRWEPFAGREVPFLGCDDLAVFKAFFDRTKDWADLEAMAQAGALDVSAVAAVLARYLGPGDARITRLYSLSE